MVYLVTCASKLTQFQHAAEKLAEKYEASNRELVTKVEDLNKHVNDLAQQRIKLQGENNELLKELHDVKVQLDNVQHVKHQLAQQLEEARRRLEDAERVSPSCLLPDTNPTATFQFATFFTLAY